MGGHHGVVRGVLGLLALQLLHDFKETQAQTPQELKALLVDALAALLAPLERPLVIGATAPTVIMVAGVNGAGKTTSIGKLTHRLADGGASVLLAAADTFRAAAREQLAIWAARNTRSSSPSAKITRRLSLLAWAKTGFITKPERKTKRDRLSV